MRSYLRWLALFFLVASPALLFNPVATETTDAAPQKSRKDRKDKPKKEAARKAPSPWKWQEKSPWSGFLWMGRQLPDMNHLPSGTEEMGMSAVAARGKEMLFLDGCKIRQVQKNWKVQKCQMVTLDQNDFLSRLVKKGADLKPDPNSLEGIKKLFNQIRKARSPEDIVKYALPAVQKKEKGNRLADQLNADYEKCGKKRFILSLQSLPTPTFMGANIVVWELNYTHTLHGKSNTVSASFARTPKGWVLGKLRVQCL